MSFVVAIDGPAGTGKGTVAKILAEKLDLINIDTGAMYRCVALKALRENVKPEELEKVKNILQNINIEIKINKKEKIQEFFLNNENVSSQIRTPEVDKVVAIFSAIKEVRDKLTTMQRGFKKVGNIVMEGRDIGTTVFPDAEIKIYLDAKTEERARRRYKQNLEKNIQCTYEEVLDSIKKRNKLETERKISPLKKAEDAVYIDTTNMTIDEVVNKICSIIDEKVLGKKV